MQTSRSRKNYGHEPWKLPEVVGRAFYVTDWRVAPKFSQISKS